ncbi:MAG TPA: ABC transporter ATP-binding protein [Polyangiaceae bacterium]|jgi:ABC-2 type transport system ATP-binding protein|nr:ABC transporter ATP-binding protein [Polyangiaceae bacterium]
MIEVSRLSKNYGSVKAVRDISFTVESGTVVGFLGPNGAGKSTTLRILAGFLGATAGNVRIGGHDIVTERARALEQLGYMPETSPLYPEMRVAEYLRFRSELKGVPRADRKREVDRVLERARVVDRANVLIGHLSKGYRQRVGLADALLGSPPLLILDEPTAGLDPNQIREVRALIRELGESHTVLLSTHILSEVEVTCERVLVIHKGNLVAEGPLRELGRKLERSTVEVLVSGKEARDVLEAVEGVATTRVLEEGTLERIEVELESADEEGRTCEALVFALAKAGIGLRELRPKSASLEEIFSQLTSEEK